MTPSDRRVFDSIVVITDRRVLDRQLQTHDAPVRADARAWSRTSTRPRASSRRRWKSGKTIIVTTLQKFPVIAKEIGELPGKRFAVIVDEAHSSQSGESTKSLKAVLASGSLEEAEREESRGRDARGGAGRHHPGRDGEARAAAEPLHLRLHRHAQAEDARAVRHASAPTGSSSRSTSTACGRRSRRASSSTCSTNYTTYKAYWRLLEEGRGRPALRQEQGRVPAASRSSSCTRTRSARRCGSWSSTSPRRCRARSAAGPRR